MIDSNKILFDYNYAYSALSHIFSSYRYNENIRFDFDRNAPIIDKFRGDYYFLSNFYPATFMYDCIIFQNSEAAFQAQKCIEPEEKLKFSNMTGAQAKHAGKRVRLRPDWENVKVEIMRDVVYSKFAFNIGLLQLLKSIDSRIFIEEGNTWRDTFWGVYNGKGKNILGEILMSARNDIIMSGRI